MARRAHRRDAATIAVLRGCRRGLVARCGPLAQAEPGGERRENREGPAPSARAAPAARRADRRTRARTTAVRALRGLGRVGEGRLYSSARQPARPAACARDAVRTAEPG